MDFLLPIWNPFIVNPLTAGLRFFAGLFEGAVAPGMAGGLAIILFTIAIRLLLLPLTLAQVRSQKKMMAIQPQLQALQKKFKGDREGMARAQMALYREQGVNPAAGCLPLLVQMPILFGMYAAMLNLSTLGLTLNVVQTQRVEPGRVTYEASRTEEPFPFNQWTLAILHVVPRGSGPISLEVPLEEARVAHGGTERLAVTQGLTPIRRYESGERGAVVAGLAWTPWALAVGLAVVLLDDRRFELAGRDALARTREWAVLAIAAASGAVAVTAEGVRLRRRMVWVGGTGGLLAALLMAIAMSQPENVQAYTVPAGIYFVVLGLTWRRSRKFFGAHMLAHEAVVVLGLLCLILPPAEQSFAPGGAVYGLELIGLGLLFLLVGFTLSARWLVSGSVLTLSGVAVRWLTIFGREAPYWLTLGLVGMALLGGGMLLLLQRERWERARRRIGRWWLETPEGWASPPDPLPGKFEG